MKGWVYVITNRAMPSMVKVGFSTKDPDLRANELNHTGSPHPYRVEYEALVEEPYTIEQKTHQLLSLTREGKEWFNCSVVEAIAAIKQIAGKGIIHEALKDVDTQHILGLMYFTGQGVPKDEEEAVRWFRLASNQGHAGAQANLGVMYSNGCGVLKDEEEAARWFRRAADQGDANAQYSLGVIY